MDTVLALFAGHAFLGGRAAAFKARTAAEATLRANPHATVFLDFAFVEGVSHSFADELLSSLADFFQGEVSHRVFLTNCSMDVLADLKSVAEMHGLPMLLHRGIAPEFA